MQLKVGDNVVMTNPYGSKGSLRDATVTKVGRKWVEFSNRERALIGAHYTDTDRGSPSEIFRSREEYLESQALKQAWIDFRRTVEQSYRCPETVTLNAIEQARRLFGFEVG